MAPIHKADDAFLNALAECVDAVIDVLGPVVRHRIFAHHAAASIILIQRSWSVLLMSGFF